MEKMEKNTAVPKPRVLLNITYLLTCNLLLLQNLNFRWKLVHVQHSIHHNVKH
jgi:hypothetical protein